MDNRLRDALDRHITGNWGEDQFKEDTEPNPDTVCPECGYACPLGDKCSNCGRMHE